MRNRLKTLQTKNLQIMKLKLFTTAILLTVAFAATAQDNRSLADERLRIRQGVKSGQLTQAERIRLQQQIAAIRSNAMRFKANDGRISRVERMKLRRDCRRLNRQIVIQKHDRQRRPF
jgi:hypothetical protein